MSNSYTIDTIANSFPVELTPSTRRAGANIPFELTGLPVLTSPTHLASGVSVDPEFDWAEFVPDVAIANMVFLLEVDEIATTGTTPDWVDTKKRVVEETNANLREVLDPAKVYAWRVSAKTRTQPSSFIDTFERATLDADYESTTLEGVGSASIINDELVIEVDATSQISRQAVRLIKNFENPNILLKGVQFSDTSTDFQPVIYFNDQGVIQNNQMNGYYLYKLGDSLKVGKSVMYDPEDKQSTTFPISVNTPYHIKKEVINGHIRISVWESANSETDPILDWIDNDSIYTSGGITFIPVAVSGAGVQTMIIDDIEVTFTEGETVNVTGINLNGSSSDLSENQTRDFTWEVLGTNVNQELVEVTATGGTIEQFTDSARFTPDGFGSASVTVTSTQDDGFSDTINFTVNEVVEGSYEDNEQGDLQFLKDLYTTMDGDNWDNTVANDKPWDPSATSLPSGTSWYGVTVENSRVVHLDLQRGSHSQPADGSGETKGDAGNNLRNKDGNGDLIAGREFPDTVGNLQQCKYFNVKSNAFTGPVPKGIDNLIRCERILLAGHWREPDPFGGMNHPTVSGTGKTSAGRNWWTGNIDYLDPTKLQEARVFELSQAGITGPIPYGFLTLPNLQMFLMLGVGDNASNENLMNGPLPSDFDTGVPSLRYLFIGSANYDDTPLPKLENCTDMKFLRCDGNSILDPRGFSGQVPTEWGNFNEVRMVTLSFNKLTGPFPSWLFPMSSTLSLTDNNFNEGFPETLSMSGGFNVLGLSRNPWGDSLKDWMVEARLIQLNLDNAGLTGTVPASWLDPMARAWSGSTGENGRIRNIRLNDNPQLGGQLPRMNWLKPSNFNAATRALFRGCSFNTSSWDMTEDGRESSNTGPIVSKTRRQWYQHFFDQTSF